MKNTLPHKFALALALTLALEAPLRSQTAPAATTPAAVNETPVVLEVFAVNIERNHG